MELGVIISLVAATVNLLGIVIAVYKLGRAVEKFEQIGVRQSHEISDLKDGVKVMGELMTKLAVQNQQLSQFGQRIGNIEAIIEDLRRGEGFILPISPKTPSQQ